MGQLSKKLIEKALVHRRGKKLILNLFFLSILTSRDLAVKVIVTENPIIGAEAGNTIDIILTGMDM